MKTKALVLRVVAVMVLVAMVNVVAVSQKHGNQNYQDYITYTHPVYTQTVVVENQPTIKDWMLDEMAFVYHTEKPQMEDWMVLLDTEKDWYMADEYYTTDWLFVEENQFEADLFDWMMEDLAVLEMDFSESLEEVEVQEWMLDDAVMAVESEDAPVILQDWMLQGFDAETNVVLHDWMLNQASWN